MSNRHHDPHSVFVYKLLRWLCRCSLDYPFSYLKSFCFDQGTVTPNADRTARERSHHHGGSLDQTKYNNSRGSALYSQESTFFSSCFLQYLLPPHLNFLTLSFYFLFFCFPFCLDVAFFDPQVERRKKKEKIASHSLPAVFLVPFSVVFIFCYPQHEYYPSSC